MGDFTRARLLSLSKPEQAQAALWEALRSRSRELEEGSLPGFLSRIQAGPSGPGEPGAWLRSLGWDAVPLLVEHIDDATPTQLWYDEHLFRVGDLCWLALRSFAGLPGDPGEPFVLSGTRAGRLRSAMDSWWRELEPLPEEDRWYALFRSGSATARAWLLERVPERCLAESWKNFDPETREGQLGRLSIEDLLSHAPLTKLEQLREAAEPEIREAIDRSIAHKVLEEQLR